MPRRKRSENASREKKHTNVKLRIETKKRLEALLNPGETFDQLISRLLDRLAELEKRVVELEREVARAKEVVEEEKVRKSVDAVQLDKAAWYVTKLTFSVQALKDLVEMSDDPNAIDQQLRRLKKVCDQVAERYGVRTDMLFEIAHQYATTQAKDDKILLNEATKEVVKSIITKMLTIEVLR